MDDKKNELDAIPKLLDMINVKRCTVTIDAMGCQKNIAEKIIEKKAHYVLAVKGNQGSLHEAAIEMARMLKPDSIQKEVDADHGRDRRAHLLRIWRSELRARGMELGRIAQSGGSDTSALREEKREAEHENP